MAVLQITIPDELKTQFEQAFPGQDIDTVVSHLMNDAVEQARTNQRERRSKAIEELLAVRQQTPQVSSDEIQAAREWVRP
ncbi:MAG: hypothetical protein ACOYMG_11735 [Candidatus Methylumidiphilus sp.]